MYSAGLQKGLNNMATDELDEIFEEFQVATDFEAELKTALEQLIADKVGGEFDRGTVYGLRKSLAYLDSQPDDAHVRKLIHERLATLTNKQEGENNE